ncbi:putative NADP-dependent alcohol dehydrogenase [Tilletiaria anomala UBC 951]|uniref:Putative NADP-dependent alcohol dehydrogenase n=1 Tax=Tilletiaria anomala (strain ATCC 24038 / CBS 436.72 / UBC 951) TaxID=1037660 RepID=A0A066VLS3_TILAU|nr:putative NADP-dependent alcohol dehydrogenase [Tilletiaria anomala UBC 951]KDN42406.1 putative NADP-dependent alcohol dehydrogenase [Tilletiaria anomala UBC 951]
MSDTVHLGTVYTGSSSGRVTKRQGGSRPVGPHTVVIKVTHSGICWSDMHFLKEDDMVLGHEPVGVVVQVGSKVRRFKNGDRVGWGCIHDSCLSCTDCVNGNDQNCRYKKAYGSHDRDQGGFGDTACIEESFVHKIPDGLPMENAAVFQCAGATVVGGLVNAGVQPFDRVAILGVGGLGHLAIQFAAAMGCAVIAVSGTMSKKEEALSLGAHEFVSIKDNPRFQGVKPVNHLLVCSSAQPDWKALFRFVKPRGTVVPLSVAFGNFNAPYSGFLSKELRVIGSLVCGRDVHEKMLEFACRHGIIPMIEQVSMTEENLNTAMDRLKRGDVRYRFVMVNPTNKGLLAESKL